MDKTLQVQLQIRQNAEEISSALKEIGQWEKTIKQKDRNVLKSTPKPRVTSTSSPSFPSSATAQLRSGGGTVPLKATPVANETHSQPRDPNQFTPASIININQVAIPVAGTIPKARGKFENRDAEEVERERGNQEFKAGNFTAAVKCYTKCLGLKSKNYIAFSNRAMTYLKMKEYSRAVIDCNSALHIEPSHVKSLMRRATANNALGKHRAALKDLLCAADLEPTNKQVKVDIQQTKEQLRSAVNRAPLIGANFLDVESLLVSSDDPQPGSETPAIIEVAQGPDPLPNGETMRYEEPEVQDGFQRIHILDDEDEENDLDPKVESVTERLNAPPNRSRVEIEKSYNNISELEGDLSPSKVSIGEDRVVPRPTKTVATKSKAKEGKKDNTNSSSASTNGVVGAYELEKTLLQLQKDDKLLTKFITGLKRKSLCATLSKSQQLEPSVVYLLLKAVSEVYGRIKANWGKVVDWYESVSQLSSFRLLFQLMVTEERSELQQRVRQALDAATSSCQQTEEVDQISKQRKTLSASFEL